MSYKPLTDHQEINLWYIYDDDRKSSPIRLERLNVSVLRSLIRRGLVNIVPTNEGRGEGLRIDQKYRDARTAEEDLLNIPRS